MIDKVKLFKNTIDKHDIAKLLTSVKFSIYLHTNHENRTRGLTIVFSLKHKIYRKKALHMAHIPAGFAPLALLI